MDTLKDKVAVVTGAGSGIGRGIAVALAQAGANVVVSDVRADACEAVRAELAAMGATAIAVAADVAQLAQVEALAQAAWARFGRVDILCNNAGVTWRPLRTILDATLADWKFIFDINVWGVVHGMTVFLPRMKAQAGRKHIVNTASIAAVLPLAGHAAYTASKAAIAAYTECAAEELRDLDFGFTVLCPAYVKTGVVENSESMRKPGERGSERGIVPYENKLMERLFTAPVDPVEVGNMVCDAILRNQLYCHTHGLPKDVVARRVANVFGEAGRAA